MSFTWTRDGGRSSTVLASVVIVIVIACAAMPAASQAAEPASHQPAWTAPGSAAETPTLTNEAGLPHDGISTELSIGLALLALGVLGAACGVIAYVRQQPPPSAAAATTQRARGFLTRT